MSKPPFDLTGQRFTRLVALYPERMNSRLGWLCQCDCGKKHWVRTSHLKDGKTRSCGCLAAEISSEGVTKVMAANGVPKKPLVRRV